MDRRLPTIETDRLVLRPYTPSDSARVQEMCADWAVASMTLTMPHPYPEGAAEPWIAGHAEQFRDGSAVRLAVTRKSDGRVVGTVGLDVSKKHTRAELSYMVAKECWGRGYCTEASRALMRFGFDVLGLNRIHATHFPRNPASGRVMQKLGMAREGLLRQYARGHGAYEDLVMYSVLRAEFGSALVLRDTRVVENPK